MILRLQNNSSQAIYIHEEPLLNATSNNASINIFDLCSFWNFKSMIYQIQCFSYICKELTANILAFTDMEQYLNWIWDTTTFKSVITYFLQINFFTNNFSEIFCVNDHYASTPHSLLIRLTTWSFKIKTLIFIWPFFVDASHEK